MKNTVNFFAQKTAHIDVVRDNKLETIYFILLPYCFAFPKDKKILFHDNVDRSSVKSKVTYLVQQSEPLIKILKHEEFLQNFFIEYKFLAIFANFDKLWKDIAFLLTIVLNVFVIFSFNSVI